MISYRLVARLCFLSDLQFLVIFTSCISIVKLHEPSFCFNIIIGAHLLTCICSCNVSLKELGLGWWVGGSDSMDRESDSMMARHKAIYFSWFGPELFCLLLGPPGFNCWFSFAPVFQWCCSTPQGSPGIGRNTFLSSPHLCFIIVFNGDLFVSRDDPLMSWKPFMRTEQLYVLSHDRS